MLPLGIDLELFKKHEDIVKSFRNTNSDYLLICEFVGSKNEDKDARSV